MRLDDVDDGALNPARPTPAQSRALLLLTTAAMALAWANVAAGPFQWDDYAVIVNNPRVHALGAWVAALRDGIRPVLALTYAVQWVAGAGPGDFHRLNFAIHAVNVVLAWRLCRRLVGPTPAAVAALLFAIHPVQTEAVTYVSGRSASLAALFYLTGLLAWPCARDGAWGRRVLALGAFALALGSKETAVTWPAALLLLEVAADPAGGWAPALRRTAPAWAMAVVATTLLAMSPRYRALLQFSLALRDPLTNLPTGVQAMGYLLSRLVLVRRLSIDPGLVAPAGWSALLAAGAAVIVAGAAVALATMRRHAATSFAVLWFLLQLLPTGSLVARADVVSERHLYLALLGPALLAGIALETLRSRGSFAAAIATAAVAIAVAVLAVATHLRNRDYASEVTLWAAAVRLTPDNPRALNNLGWAWHRAGCPGEARAAYEAALLLQPDHPTARGNLAGVATAPAAPCALGWEALGLRRPSPATGP